MASTPSTHMESLIAELLGDVGSLHDTIKALPEALAAVQQPVNDAAASMDEAGKRAEEKAEKLLEAATGAASHIVKMLNQHLADVQARKGEELRELMNEAATDAVRKALSREVHALTSRLDSSIAAVESAARNLSRPSREQATASRVWPVIVSALAGSIIGGGAIAYLVVMFH